MKYTEIFKLEEMLERADIPFEFQEVFTDSAYEKGYQIGYPVLPPNNNNICSVVEHGFSYGHRDDLLEIMGLLTDEERENDSVVGWLSAENVFDRIKKHYEGVKNNEINETGRY